MKFDIKRGNTVNILNGRGILIVDGKLQSAYDNIDGSYIIKIREFQRFCPDCMLMFKDEKSYLKHRRRKHGEKI